MYPLFRVTLEGFAPNGDRYSNRWDVRARDAAHAMILARSNIHGFETHPTSIECLDEGSESV